MRRSACVRKAEECGNRAKIERDPSLVRDYLDMERRWLSLARTYQFSEQLDTFYKFNRKRQEDTSSIIERMVRKTDKP